MENDVELVIIHERFKSRSISRTYPNYKGKSFQIPTQEYLEYLAVKRRLNDLEDKLIAEAREQGAYAPMKEKPMFVARYHVKEGETHKFNDDGSVTIKFNG